MQSASSAGPSAAIPAANRWLQLIIGIVCMVMIANLQYGWTLFVHPMNVAHGWAVADIQIAFSIFVALETWLTPIQGWIVDRVGPKNGPRLMVAFGGILVGIGWIVNSSAGTLAMLYLGAISVRHRRRRRLRNLRWQCGKVVPGPPGARRRADRGGLWRGRRADRYPDPRSHRRTWLCGGVLLVRAGPGRRRLCAGVADARAAAG